MVELNTKAQNESNIPEAPHGTHNLQCFVVIDLGQQKTNYGLKHKIKIGFESDQKIPMAEGIPEWAQGKPYGFYKTFALSANEKSSLMKFLNNWFTDLESELEKNMKENGKVDLSKLLVGRYGTGVIGNEKWNDGEMHTTLKSVIPASPGHKEWQLVNGPSGSSDSWKYPKSVREARANSLVKPEDYPNDFDQENDSALDFPPKM